MSITAIQERIAQVQALRQSRMHGVPAGTFQGLLEQEIESRASAPETSSVSTAASYTADALGSLPPGVLPAENLLSLSARSPASVKIIEDAHANAGRVTYSGQVNAEIQAQAQPYMSIIEEASSLYGVPANIIMAVIKRESDFSQYETSYSGAMGFMQNMPFNCEDYGVTEPYDPYQNILCGTWQIGTLLDMYDGDLRLALAGYNIGCGTLRRAGVTSSDSQAYATQVPVKVQNYVEDILRYAGAV